MTPDSISVRSLANLDSNSRSRPWANVTTSIHQLRDKLPESYVKPPTIIPVVIHSQVFRYICGDVCLPRWRYMILSFVPREIVVAANYTKSKETTLQINTINDEKMVKEP